MEINSSLIVNTAKKVNNTKNGIANPLNAENKKYNSELKTAANEFDSLMINNFLNQAFKPSEDSLFGNSFASEIYQDMQNSEMAKIFSKQGQLGLSQVIVDQYSKEE